MWGTIVAKTLLMGIGNSSRSLGDLGDLKIIVGDHETVSILGVADEAVQMLPPNTEF